MVGQKRISVAMTTYNGELFLREQLDSILEQLGETDELVISDDGSTDATVELIREYQEHDGRIRLVQGPRKGIKKNVEHVLSCCVGAYIFLTDQDDIWVEGKVQRVLELFAREQATLVIHDAVVFAGDVKNPVLDSFFSFRKSGAGVVKNIVRNSYIGCCMAFRAELLKEALPIPNKIEMHDQWLGIINDFYYKKSFFYREPLLLYRRHGANNSEMTHYGVGRMIRNRIVFLAALTGRILHLSRSRRK